MTERDWDTDRLIYQHRKPPAGLVPGINACPQCGDFLPSKRGGRLTPRDCPRCSAGVAPGATFGEEMEGVLLGVIDVSERQRKYRSWATHLGVGIVGAAVPWALLRAGMNAPLAWLVWITFCVGMGVLQAELRRRRPPGSAGMDLRPGERVRISGSASLSSYDAVVAPTTAQRWRSRLLLVLALLLAFTLGWLAAETRRGVRETVPERLPAEVAIGAEG